MANEELKKFAEALRQEILCRSQIEGEEAFLEDKFTHVLIEYLTEVGELDDGFVCYHKARGIQVNGYSYNAEESSLDLLVAVYTSSVPPITVDKNQVETAFKRACVFLEKAVGGYHKQLEEASNVFDLALLVYELRKQWGRVRVFVLSDGIGTVGHIKDINVGGLSVECHIWDLPRLQRAVSSGVAREAIEVDFVEKYGNAIPCLAVPSGESDYQAYLAVIPGNVLAMLYQEFGDRLLERNVRSFLQARGKVNRGIRDTILKSPGRFMAYNNGISATASDVDLVTLPDGGKGIRCLRDLQIVNGGQTTASIYQAYKGNADTSSVYVQAKLSVVEPEQVDELVPLISRYANSQNKISEPDFFANDPFHVQLEELSRTVWVPTVSTSSLQTKWFYERARGQYLVAMSREGTPSRQKMFKELHPIKQKFTKTDIAKFENTWDQLPYLVSRGSEKNFREFTLALKKQGSVQVDQAYFERLIAKAILFRRAEEIIGEMKLGDYRANVVTYTLAFLSWSTAQRIDLDRIWRHQNISSTLRQAIQAIAVGVRSVIANPPGGRNVTEWCKREDCWKLVQETAIDFELSMIEDDLIPVGSGGRSHAQRGRMAAQATQEDQANIAIVSEMPAHGWLQLSSWARETNNLQSWQRSIAYSIGQLLNKGRQPSIKQAAQGKLILEAALQKGFRPEQESAGIS